MIGHIFQAYYKTISTDSFFFLFFFLCSPVFSPFREPCSCSAREKKSCIPFLIVLAQFLPFFKSCSRLHFSSFSFFFLFTRQTTRQRHKSWLDRRITLTLLPAKRSSPLLLLLLLLSFRLGVEQANSPGEAEKENLVSGVRRRRRRKKEGKPCI